MKTVLMDLDSTVVDILQPWLDLYNADYNDTLRVQDITEWDTHNLVKPECGFCIYKYLESPGFFRNREMLPGAFFGLRKISQVAEIVIVTSALSIPQATVDKLWWVRSRLPFVPKDNIIVTARKDLIHGDIMVDDSPKNLAETKAVHKIVLDYPYNRDVKDAERVYDWQGVQAAVLRYVKE